MSKTYFNESGKEFSIGMGHMGNGLTVWNRLEERNGDYVTVAHISPDREVTFYENDLPEAVKALIEREAQTCDISVSATQKRPVFRSPPEGHKYSLHYQSDGDEKIVFDGTGEKRRFIGRIMPNGRVYYAHDNLPGEIKAEIETYAKTEKEDWFLNGNGDTDKYALYLFEPDSSDARIVKENYRLAYAATLGKDDTPDTVYDKAIFKTPYVPRKNGKKFGAGDIIAIKKDGELTAWYVDQIAYSKLNEFFPRDKNAPDAGPKPKTPKQDRGAR